MQKNTKIKKSNEFITFLEKEHHREIKIPRSKWKKVIVTNIINKD